MNQKSKALPVETKRSSNFCRLIMQVQELVATPEYQTSLTYSHSDYRKKHFRQKKLSRIRCPNAELRIIAYRQHSLQQHSQRCQDKSCKPGNSDENTSCLSTTSGHGLTLYNPSALQQCGCVTCTMFTMFTEKALLYYFLRCFLRQVAISLPPVDQTNPALAVASVMTRISRRKCTLTPQFLQATI